MHLARDQGYVLVVDDELAVLRLTCRLLAGAGYRCSGVGSADAALDLIETEQRPDLLVLDVRLPGMPGPALALRLHNQWPDLPVLFVSGWIDGLADAAILGALRWDFLSKPYTPERLVEAADRLINATERKDPGASA